MQPDPMVRMLARYAVAIVIVLVLLPAIARTLGLPVWITPLALSLCLLGLPVAAAAVPAAASGKVRFNSFSGSVRSIPSPVASHRAAASSDPCSAIASARTRTAGAVLSRDAGGSSGRRRLSGA